ncbi:MAG: hypothetical protein ACRD2J_12550 [Thermoanaerobaculia bacterium]
MTRIVARVPARADLAGGTLDLWPLYLFHPGSRTVNMAISTFAECEVVALAHEAIEIELTDAGVRARYSTIRELAADDRVTLIAKALEHFGLSGLRITTRTDVPRGSGLGGSSALAIALVRALSMFAGRPVEGDALIHLVRDLETRLLGIPAGIQDYYPPVYGGLAALHLDPGDVVRHPIATPLPEIARHFILHYTGVSHFSGTNNWQIYQRQVDGDAQVRSGLAAIALAAIEMERALEQRDFAAAGAALDREWIARKAMIDGISTPEVDAAIGAAVAAGAWGGKVCGAGGGGCVIILCPAERREAILEALADVPGTTLDVAPVAGGLVVEEDRQHPPVALTHRRGSPAEEDLEELWAGGEGGAYRPWVLAEAAITFDAPHQGVHRTTTRMLMAPVDLQTGVPRWSEAVPADADALDLRSQPDNGREVRAPRAPHAVAAAAAEGEQLLRETLLESETMTLLHNAAFGLFSHSGEDREDFIRRCVELAEQNVEHEAERLEKTFRRRIDQLRERSERDRREVEENDDPTQSVRHHEVGIAWGQALYNITSGRPATTEAPRSRNEADFMEKIQQLQKAWEREREIVRDEQVSRAQAVEEITLSPAPRGIDIRRYLILWVPEPQAAHTS